MGMSPADQLRNRARTLRNLAARLTGAGALTLHHRAGADTWLGAAADHFALDLQAIRRELLTAHDELLAAARQLERQAAHHEATTVLPGGAS